MYVSTKNWQFSGSFRIYVKWVKGQSINPNFFKFTPCCWIKSALTPINLAACWLKLSHKKKKHAPLWPSRSSKQIPIRMKKFGPFGRVTLRQSNVFFLDNSPISSIIFQPRLRTPVYPLNPHQKSHSKSHWNPVKSQKSHSKSHWNPVKSHEIPTKHSTNIPFTFR